MKRKNSSDLPNQMLLSFDNFIADCNSRLRGTRSASCRVGVVRPSDDRRNDGQDRPLADRRNTSLPRLLDIDREPWFLDDDDDGPADPTAA